MAGGASIVVGAILVLFGLILAFGGTLILPKATDSKFNKAVNDYVVVDSTDSQNYAYWAHDSDVKTPYYLEVYMWNLTNAADVLANGTKPEYESVGPYFWRRYRTSENVSFPDGGNQLKYQNLKRFYFQQDKSAPRAASDVITNVNPAVSLILSKTGNLQNFVGAAGCASLYPAVQWFDNVFPTLLDQHIFPTSFGQIMNENLAAIAKALPQESPLDTFAQIVFNATETPTNIPGANFSFIIVNSVKTSSLSLDTARALLSSKNKLSLVDTSAEASWCWAHALGECMLNLTTAFALSSSELTTISQWRDVYNYHIVQPMVAQKYNLNKYADVGFLQWYNGMPLADALSFPNATSVTSVWPDQLSNIFFQTVPEIGLAVKAVPLLDIAVYRKAFDTNFKLKATCQQYLLLMDTSNPFHIVPANRTAINELLPGDGANTTLFQYNSNFGMNNFQNSPYGAALLGVPGKLQFIVQRSVDEWIFHCQDPLVQIFSDISCSLQFNDTWFPSTTVTSCWDDVNKINQYVSWREQSTIDSWKESIPVHGYTDLGQFAPHQKKNESLYVFDTNLVRTVRMDYVGQGTVRDIKTYTYQFNFTQMLSPNDLYYQYDLGLANISTIRQGAPIFLSLWDMWGVDPSISGKVNGQKPGSQADASAVIQVEPQTGNTVVADQRLQVNVLFPQSLNTTDWWTDVENQNIIDPDNNKLPLGTYYPLAKIDESTFISEEMANTLKGQLGKVSKVKNVGFYIGVILGPILVVIGGILLVIGIRGRNLHRREYEGINTAQY